MRTARVLVFGVLAATGGCHGEDGGAVRGGEAGEGGAVSQPEIVACSASPGELFERRIRPLLSADHPDTCGQCHAGGIALRDFIRKDVCESMACLKQQRLVDLDHPEKSVILRFIERAEPESRLITKSVIDEEYAAFFSWIEHEARCGSCSTVTCSDREVPTCSEVSNVTGHDFDDDPMDCAPETLEQLFRGTVFRARHRCVPCHFEEELGPVSEAPRFFSASGTCQVAALRSYQNIVDGGYIDRDDPLQSLLLLKPLAENDGGVYHEGHDKILEGETTYLRFVHFLKRYVGCQSSKRD